MLRKQPCETCAKLRARLGAAEERAERLAGRLRANRIVRANERERMLIAEAVAKRAKERLTAVLEVA